MTGVTGVITHFTQLTKSPKFTPLGLADQVQATVSEHLGGGAINNPKASSHQFCFYFLLGGWRYPMPCSWPSP